MNAMLRAVSKLLYSESPIVKQLFEYMSNITKNKIGNYLFPYDSQYLEYSQNNYSLKWAS